MRFARPGLSEHILAAHFEYLCARDGAQRPAYVPVVASGSVSPILVTFCCRLTARHSPNALTIHYTSNNQLIRENELILVDAGCEYKCAASPSLPAFSNSPQRVRLGHQ